MLTLLKTGDHVLLSHGVFGNTTSFKETIEGFGIKYPADVTNVEAVEAAIQPNTRALFTETIANPVTQVADLVGLGELCQRQRFSST